MKTSIVAKLHADFEALVHVETDSGVEFWTARDLQAILGYARWENFSKVVEKARIGCETAGYQAPDHFVEVTKTIELGKGGNRVVPDVLLTRYACYLIAQNGDSSKDAIAFAQTYFAVQTRKQEIIEQRLAEVERLRARKKLTDSEKSLSGVIFERLQNNQSFGRIRSKGDKALFGGHSTQDMKERLGMPDTRPLADFLPTITIKAKDFANEITVFNIAKDDLRTETGVTNEHVKNNTDVRQLLMDRGIVPENLPAAEDAKKVERRVLAEQKKLPKQSDPLAGLDHSDET
jgi:DNA-damage-inducible protein D